MALKQMPGDEEVEVVYSAVLSYLPGNRMGDGRINRALEEIMFKIPREVAVVVAAARASKYMAPSTGEIICTSLTEVLEMAKSAEIE